MIDDKLNKIFGIVQNTEQIPEKDPLKSEQSLVKTPYDGVIDMLQTSIQKYQSLIDSSQSTAVSVGEAELYTSAAQVMKTLTELYRELRSTLQEREKWIAQSGQSTQKESKEEPTMTTTDLLKQIKPRDIRLLKG